MTRILLTFLLALPLAAQDVRPEAVRAHVKFLASDLLEGRGPGTRGDALATSYIAAQFEATGLAPAGDNGTYFQNVPLLGITTDEAKSSIALGKLGPLKFRDELVGSNQTQGVNETLDSEIVFVGHGVVAPEYRWDDYKGLDTRGKTLVMLVDDPPATEAEPDLFKGRARTYYGRWTYKYETGAAKGAEAVILIHTNAAAGYGWQVVRNSWTGEQAYVRNKPGQPALKLASWISEKVAQDLFRNAGLDLAAMTKAAGSRNFKPVPLNARLRGNITSTIRPFETANVLAKLEGSDETLKQEAVFYTAHHDHLGIGSPDDDDPNDTIYNGAIDNASGTATMLEIARAWSETRPRPKRSIYFAAVAAEEQGLLGSQYLGQHLPIAAKDVALAINLDVVYLFGKVTGVTMLGAERMTFLPTAEKVTKAMGLTIVPDTAPEQGSYYRSDHFSLAKVGVPAFSVKQGVEGSPKAKLYREKDYHQASDEYDPAWDFSAASQIGELSLRLGAEAANAAQKPDWLPGDEFFGLRQR
ncbi:MAG TPA: M28 family peptidase [Thermoanaerobaculia bacterium]|nr:M28 family peptidase [Thermoanaerobaculia bacterium]